MKQAKDAFADAIKRAEKSLRRGRKDTPQERGHAIAKLAEERAKRRREEARDFARQARRLGLDGDTLARIDAAAQAHAAQPERWLFVMMGPRENAAVVRWINANSKRPHKAHELWATLLEHLRMDTGEIMATRQELAERIGESPDNLSPHHDRAGLDQRHPPREARPRGPLLPQPPHRHAPPQRDCPRRRT